MYKFVKRDLDFLLALLLLVPVGLVILIAFVWIKLDDGGPVFYNAERIGRGGKPFKMFKLRTMRVNAPDIRLEDGSTYNAANDPRVTRFGRMARKMSIDELPQIFNILRGEMSFVGPRPNLADPDAKYSEEERMIFTVRPGITGYNQVVYRNAAGAGQKMKNDVYYVAHFSFGLDVKIFFLTIANVLRSKNIYRAADEAAEQKQITATGNQLR